MKTLADYSGTKDNNLNLLRFIAALSVVWSHSTLVVGGVTSIEPLIAETGYSLGHLAVNVFFVISGFLIAQSYTRSRSLYDYMSARFLRLFPGLIVAALFTVFILGPIATTVSLKTYFSNLMTWFYVPLTGSLLVDNGTLEGVFSGLPFASEINVSLWTLRWELLAYIGLAFLGVLQLLTSKSRFLIVLSLFLAFYLVITLTTDLRTTIAPVDHSLRFGLCFLMGTTAFMFQDKIPLKLVFATILWIPVFVLQETAFYQIALNVALAYSILWLAFIPAGPIRMYNETGDLSYGIYIYGFPLQQLVVLLVPGVTVGDAFLIALPLILIMATLSFYLVEKPSLQLRKKGSPSGHRKYEENRPLPASL